MALRQLMVSNKIKQRKVSLDELLTRQSGLKTREAAAEAAIDEAKTEEETLAVEAEIEAIEAEQKDIDEKKLTLENEIKDLEGELEQLNSAPPTNVPPTETQKPAERKQRVEGETRMLNKREKLIERLNKEEVRSFYANVSAAVKTRSLTGLDLTIPKIILDTVTDDLGRYSVFYDLVRKVQLTGEGRAIISGEAPEAVWTEMVGKINELASLFTDVEVDGYKVGGFIPIDNSLIEDSMINLAMHVEELLKESIAIALDKAILYGTGTKMPLGIVPALQADYVDADPDTGLRMTNIIKLSVADTKFAKIIEAMKWIKRGRRGRGPITIAMNEATWLGSIVPMSLGSNAAGAFVTVSGQAFPGVGYKVVFSEEIPENNILAGDFSKYLLAQRTGVLTASSTEFLFTSDKTVFKATQRFDGKPVKKSAFVLIGINNTEPTVSATFASDAANA